MQMKTLTVQYFDWLTSNTVVIEVEPCKKDSVLAPLVGIRTEVLLANQDVRSISHKTVNYCESVLNRGCFSAVGFHFQL